MAKKLPNGICSECEDAWACVHTRKTITEKWCVVEAKRRKKAQAKKSKLEAVKKATLARWKPKA